MGYYAKIIIKVKLGHNKKVFYNRGFKKASNLDAAAMTPKSGVPRPACGPPDVLVLPSSTSKYCKLGFKLLNYGFGHSLTAVS